MKNFINQFTDLEIESIEEMNDYGEIEAWMFVKEPNIKLSYVDNEEDLF